MIERKLPEDGRGRHQGNERDRAPGTQPVRIDGNFPGVPRQSFLAQLTNFERALVEADTLESLLAAYQVAGRIFRSVSEFLAAAQEDWSAVGTKCRTLALQATERETGIPEQRAKVGGVEYRVIGLAHRYGLPPAAADKLYNSLAPILRQAQHVLYEDGVMLDTNVPGISIPDLTELPKLTKLGIAYRCLTDGHFLGLGMQGTSRRSEEPLAEFLTASGELCTDYPLALLSSADSSGYPPSLGRIVLASATSGQLRPAILYGFGRSAFMAEFARRYAERTSAKEITICCGAAHVAEIVTTLRDGSFDSGITERAQAASNGSTLVPDGKHLPNWVRGAALGVVTGIVASLPLAAAVRILPQGILVGGVLTLATGAHVALRHLGKLSSGPLRVNTVPLREHLDQAGLLAVTQTQSR